MSNQWKFKPCPFCGSTDIKARSEVINQIMGHDYPCSAVTKVWGQCEYCGATGSRRTGDIVYNSEILALALEGWNQRKGD